MSNLAEQISPRHGPFQCSCGKWYSTQEGVVMCQSNQCGSGKNVWDRKGKFYHTTETVITVVCAECGEKITSTLHDCEGAIELRVWPHVCAVDGGDDE